MNEPGLPRWGAHGRERKALAILQVMGARAGAWLDVGCGSGGIAAELAAHVAHVTGVDPEPWPQWDEATRRHANLRFVVARFDEAGLPLAPCSADVVVCNQVYEHVGDARQLFDNLARVMAPQGRCYFAGPNLLWPIEPHVHWPLVHWLPRAWAVAAMRALGSRRAHELDAHSLDAWRLARRLRAAGLALEPALAARVAAECWLRGWPRLAACVARVPRWLERLLLPFAPGFAFILRHEAPA